MYTHKIGITEGGDAGRDLSWADKLDTVDGAVLITKSPSSVFNKLVMEHADKLILHVGVTGYGGTIVERNVPPVTETRSLVSELISMGFPKERIVIRVDPIIPTDKGINRARKAFEAFTGFSRYRISILDMYRHVRERFVKAGLYDPYSGGFGPNVEQVRAVDALLADVRNENKCAGIYSCAEVGLANAERIGCISQQDLNLLGLPYRADQIGRQRGNCLCFSGKTELLGNKRPCINGCLYCYWR